MILSLKKNLKKFGSFNLLVHFIECDSLLFSKAEKINIIITKKNPPKIHLQYNQ